MVTITIRRRVSAPRQASAVLGRNVSALRSGAAYWLIITSGFVEPVLYLLSIGVGVGALIGHIRYGGQDLSYARFIAPAMLTTSAMNGAMSETVFNFFDKLKYRRTFEAMLATPIRPVEIAAGELAWATARSAFYSAAFLVIMVLFGYASPVWAVATFPVAVLVALAFGAAGMAASTLLRGWQDFDYVGTSMFALFLFSATFSPITAYPGALQLIVRATPLYQGTVVIRGLVLGQASPLMAAHLAYLAVMAVVCLAFAARRIATVLCP